MHVREIRRRRKAQRMSVPILLIASLLMPALLGPDAARAHAGVYARSLQPYWNVGQLDPELSKACRHGRFNQLSDHRLHIGYRGEAGAGTTGIARQNWNLRDPDRRSRPDDTYHFADDGLSTCRVYVAKDPPPAGR